MDRFIEIQEKYLKNPQLHLKSSMDRFIDVEPSILSLDRFYLKSSMDRFIANEAYEQTKLFKI